MKLGHSTVAAACLTALALSLSAGFSPASAKGKSLNGCGRASWYALTSRTASGEMMDARQLTAAHRSLPFGTLLQVTNPHNGRTIIVRINDRGPFVGGRVLDLSKAAAKQLNFIQSGVTKVCMTTELTVPLPRARPNQDRRPLDMFRPVSTQTEAGIHMRVSRL